VAEANALLPRLNALLGRLASLRREIEDGLAAMRAPAVLPAGCPAADGPGTRWSAGLQARVQALRDGWAEVEATSAVVKDMRLGLLDLYGRRDDRLVWLCWRYGEPAVSFWHPLETGLAGRRPLEPEAIPPTLN
jgi:hypothetical protein